MLGYESQEAAEAAYLTEMPSEFFGGIREVALGELEQYRKGDPVFAEDSDRDGVDDMTDRAGKTVAQTVAEWAKQFEALLQKSGSLGAFRDSLEDLYDEMPTDAFTATFAEAMLAAELMGRFEVVEENDLAESDVELAETPPLVAETPPLVAEDPEFAKNCNPAKSHLCGGSCVPLTKKCRSKASPEVATVMDYVTSKGGSAEPAPETKPKKPRKKAAPKTEEPEIESIGAAIASSPTLQKAATKSSRVAEAMQKLKDVDEKVGGPVREKIREFVKKNPNAIEDIAVSAVAVAGQFALMPQADVATASLLQGAIGVVARSGMRSGKRVKEELKADPEALKSAQGILKVSRKVLSDFRGRDLQETLIGDAIGPSIANASGAAVGGGWLGTIVGTVAAVGGAPKAAKAIRQRIQSTGSNEPIPATT
jgi:gas vesicle protein